MNPVWLVLGAAAAVVAFLALGGPILLRRAVRRAYLMSAAVKS